MTWLKSRSGTYGAYNPQLYDAVRGAGASKDLTPASSAVEGVDSGAHGYISAFGTDGFTLTAGSSNSVQNNGASTEYVSWNWKANGQGSSNTAGSINTTYTSVDATAGISISKYTGTGSAATVGHGLGVTPDIAFFKRLDSSANWVVQTPFLGNKVQLVLNDDSAENTDSRLGASDDWSNSVFTVGTYGDMNANGGTYVAYCFASKTGYSKIGTYKGNGNADGAFIYTGFKPAWVVCKSADTTSHWNCFDNTRSPINPVNDYLKLNDNSAENVNVSDIQFDFVSNGLKIRGNNDEYNGNNERYVYMAFAAEPLVANLGTNGVPATAK